MAYNIRVASSTSSVPQYWSQQVVSATQKNIYYNFGNAGIGIPLPKASLHLVNNCCIGSAFATSNVPTDSLIVSSNVGIGTALPQATLHVQGNAIISGNLTVQGSNIVNNQIVNNIEYNSSNVIINNLSGLGPALKVSQSGVGANYPIADFYDNDVSTTIPALRIADGGYVGIGTDNPVAKLHVNGDVLSTGWVGETQIWSGVRQSIPFYLVLYKTASQAIPLTTYTKVTFAPYTGTTYVNLKTSTLNAGSYWNTTTNGFTPPVNGIYNVNIQSTPTSVLNLWMSKGTIANSTAENLSLGYSNGSSTCLNITTYMTTTETYYIWAFTGTAVTINATPSNGTSVGGWGEIMLIQALV